MKIPSMMLSLLGVGAVLSASTVVWTQEEPLDPFDALDRQVAEVQSLLRRVSSFPPGTILMWSGSPASLPEGWVLCDGSNGTPDLRGRFIVGASGGEEPGNADGADSHDHDPLGHVHAIASTAHSHSTDSISLSSSENGHAHGLMGGPSTTHRVDDHVESGSELVARENHAHPYTTVFHQHVLTVPGRATTSTMIPLLETSSDSPSGSGADHRPPFFKLAFIMKVAAT